MVQLVTRVTLVSAAQDQLVHRVKQDPRARLVKLVPLVPEEQAVPLGILVPLEIKGR